MRFLGRSGQFEPVRLFSLSRKRLSRPYSSELPDFGEELISPQRQLFG